MPRIIGCFAIGGTSTDLARRLVGWPELLAGGGGVAEFVAKRVTPAMDVCGFTSVAVWTPWGHTLKNAMAYMPASSYLLALEARLRELTDGWEQVWGEVAARCRAAGGEAICYAGGLREDTSFASFSIPGFLKRCRESFAPIRAAKMSQAFDAEVLAPDGSREAEMVLTIDQDLRSAGLCCYVEALHKLANRWCWNLPWIARDDEYRRCVNADGSVRSDIRPDPRTWPRGVRIMIPPAGESADSLDSLRRWGPAAAAAILADGHDVMVNPYPFRDAGVDCRKVLGLTGVV